ncbi:capsular polysaccharide biosynthesis protein [Paraliobacillus quinghaiensis]|uniref:Capsular polysaccharide biosynthesis protein n=1 Tax=Paraliobacillus quinghaiensis TaxID=470815 RepID=A0A917WW38_9BACI|nr:CapA family protein [Paraliobacillus quinghaiensis]GGM34217.1 capsular polysaccharide biosynthesis protein [Paraliobacillus quinghaiensis]
MNRFILIVMIGILFLLGACSNTENTQYAEDHKKQERQITIEKEYFETKPKITSIKLAAIGDMLIHGIVYNDAKTEAGFDFSPMLEQVAPYLSEPTIAMANQETMIGGEEVGLSTYPRFNSPYQVGDALDKAGVDIVTLANNHTLDVGEKAIQNALNHWDQIGMLYTGAYRDQKDSERIRVMETEAGIDVSFLGYTYGTNGIPVPAGKDYLVNLINHEEIAADVKAAEEISDITVMNLHFGAEYQRMPNDDQKELVQYVADLGVDIIMGHHPHVLQPMEWIEGKGGNKTFVVYSLGNFLSGQDEFYRRIGGMVEVTIEKKVTRDEEKIQIVTPRFLPTFVDYDENIPRNDFQVIPMYQLDETVLPAADRHYQEIKKHMSQWMPEVEFIESE